MKKVLILILAVVLSFSVFAMVACNKCETHVDANHDGICDVCEAEGVTYEHIDANHDGKCDACSVSGLTVNHVDANSDGTCDVCQHKEAWVTALADAKAYVDTLYLNETVATTDNFKVVTVVAIGGVQYNIAWAITSDVAGQTAAVLGEVGADKQQEVVINSFSASEVAYKLVGTISDANGHSVVVEYGRKVPAFVVATWAEYVAACEANDAEAIISVRGYITAVNADSGSSSKGSVWVRDAEGHGYYAYKPSLDASVTASRESILAAFPVGAEVVISGTVGNKFGNQHNAGCTVKLTGNHAPEGWNTPVDQTEAFSNAEGMLDSANLDQYYASMVTLNGVTMGNIDGYNYYFTINGKEYICYMNIYLMDSEASTATAAKWVVGGKANITGLVTTYSKKFQIYPYGPDCIEIVKEDLTDAEIVERAKSALAFDFDHVTAACEEVLPSAIQGYEVTLSWALDKEYAFASISEGKLVVTELPAEETTIKLVATITKGAESDTVEYSITVDAKPSESLSSINLTIDTLGLESQKYQAGTATIAEVGFQFTELGSYGNGVQMRVKDGVASKLWNTAALPRTIVSIKITLNADKDVYDNTDVWEFKFGSAADALTESIKLSTVKDQYTYTITPTAGSTFFSMEKILANYTFYVDSISIIFEEETVVVPSHTCESACDACGGCLDAECTETACATKCPTHQNHTTIEGALAGAKNDTAVLSGTVSEINYAWSDSSKNMSFYISDGTNQILVYKSTTKVGLGDVVSVEGVIGVYNSKNQIAEGSTVAITTAHVCAEWNAATCEDAELCKVCGEAKEGSVALGHTYAEGVCSVCGAEEVIAHDLSTGALVGDWTCSAKDEVKTLAGWTSTASKAYGQQLSAYHTSFRNNNEAITSAEFVAVNAVTVDFKYYLNNTQNDTAKTSQVKIEALDANGNVVDTFTSDNLDDGTTYQYKTVSATLEGTGIVQIKVTFVKNGGGNIGIHSITIAIPTEA